MDESVLESMCVELDELKCMANRILDLIQVYESKPVHEGEPES